MFGGLLAGIGPYLAAKRREDSQKSESGGANSLAVQSASNAALRNWESQAWRPQPMQHQQSWLQSPRSQPWQSQQPWYQPSPFRQSHDQQQYWSQPYRPMQSYPWPAYPAHSQTYWQMNSAPVWDQSTWGPQSSGYANQGPGMNGGQSSYGGLSGLLAYGYWGR